MRVGFGGTSKIHPHASLQLFACYDWKGIWMSWWTSEPPEQINVAVAGFYSGRPTAPSSVKGPKINTRPFACYPAQWEASNRTLSMLVISATRTHRDGIGDAYVVLGAPLFFCLASCLCYLNILLCTYKDRKWVIQNLTTVLSVRQADVPGVWGGSYTLSFLKMFNSTTVSLGETFSIFPKKHGSAA